MKSLFRTNAVRIHSMGCPAVQLDATSGQLEQRIKESRIVSFSQIAFSNNSGGGHWRICFWQQTVLGRQYKIVFGNDLRGQKKEMLLREGAKKSRGSIQQLNRQRRKLRKDPS